MFTQMQKILILVLLGGLVAGCSWVPFDGVVHKIDIQQGNIIDQADIDQLRPGMEKRQVRFIMGSPMIVDTFNQHRWEYIYRQHRSGSAPSENKRISLYFDNNKLNRIEGDLRPQPTDESVAKKSEIIEVPLKDKEDKGIVRRVVDTVTFDKFSDEE
jgi:outer membrane protein assembly factor BamE